ncbi:hypothetical protein C1H46_034977 [Malus baccata]|uniref:Uncharacterized protein n=1 Tax=Malus baccata TaxID=106549 RepID=A0A540KZ18_MALBA|nr:hypothetical protein C1H46_034977 [Malus baccata]
MFKELWTPTGRCKIMWVMISVTTALAQKNSEATQALAAQEDILEKELGEIQKVLLAMQISAAFLEEASKCITGEGKHPRTLCIRHLIDFRCVNRIRYFKR